MVTTFRWPERFFWVWVLWFAFLFAIGWWIGGMFK